MARLLGMGLESSRQNHMECTNIGRFEQDKLFSMPARSMHSKAHYCFVVEYGDQTGPFPPSQIERMWRDGEITDAAFVGREGLTDWQLISSGLTRTAGCPQKAFL